MNIGDKFIHIHMIKKKHEKNYWNYRVVTRVIKGMIGHNMTTRKEEKLPDERVFSITEVYYKNGKPNSYVESNDILQDRESKRSLKWILKKAKKALKKPILDLDNWPKKYHPNTSNH